MVGGEEIFGNLSDLTVLPSIFETITNFTLDDLDDLFAHTFNDSFAPSIEPIPEMIPQQTEITLDDLFLPTCIIAPSIEPIPEISSSLPEEVDNINSGVIPSAVLGVELKQLDEEKKVHEKVKSRRKYEVWTEEEHRLFLKGLEKYGKAKPSKIWKKISTEFVASKTPKQVSSHAQKFNHYQRQKNVEGKSLRRSINDIIHSKMHGL